MQGLGGKGEGGKVWIYPFTFLPFTLLPNLLWLNPSHQKMVLPLVAFLLLVQGEKWCWEMGVQVAYGVIGVNLT
ncbi:hypothetical protein FDUTEX481_04900 [Tolypothrix sp. PCC 7601]|nr:hypothetical protein FDUTEX481_04900 [Tolypothrix sp. PCC 7601]